MADRLKGLDLIDRVLEELWMEVHDIVQKAVIKTIPKKNKYKQAKWLSEEVLQLAEKRREAKGKEEKKTMGMTRDIFKKLEISREHFIQRWAQ